MPRKGRVVVVDGQDMFRDLLVRVCETELNCEVMGVAKTGGAGLDLIKAQDPDIVLLDSHLSDMNGYVLMEIFKQACRAPRFLLVSGCCNAGTVHRVMQSRVAGFVDKETSTVAMLREAVVAVLAGQSYFCARFESIWRSQLNPANSPFKILSPWECQILAQIAQCKTDQEIGLALGIAPRTVKTHRSNLLRKLSIKSSLKLVAFGLSFGFAE
ncbi:MAG: response regulator transcription factor [Verrucomicrobia bacterium]|nr:response regulator transcription factor [Verrucomicrobiota bacterium]